MNGRAIVCPLKELSKDHDWTGQVFPVSCVASGLDFSKELRLAKKGKEHSLKKNPREGSSGGSLYPEPTFDPQNISQPEISVW